jgi:hypothetical protein
MAAGLGFKDFVTGEVLTAADVDGYLMQGIWVFANAAARDAAVTSPQEGNACYLKDTNEVLTYSGSAWVAVGGSVPASLQYAAGKNKFINGDFYVNQRGFTTTTSTGVFMFDRFSNFVSDGTVTFSNQTFTAGTAPVAGYEGKCFLQSAVSGQTAAGAASFFSQKIEDVRSFAGQTVTISFWAKANSGTPKIAIEFTQNFGSGGSPSASVGPTAIGTVTLSTSWARYTTTYAIPSISGKTVGTTDGTSYLEFGFWTSAGTTFATRASSIGIQNSTIGVWGFQVEEGSTVTDFQTATGTIQGELAACQRYFVRTQDGSIYITQVIGMGSYFTSSQVDVIVNLPVRMRAIPTFSAPTGTDYYRISRNGADDSFNSLTLNSQNGPLACALYNNAQVSGTAGQVGMTQINNTSAYLDFSAEL